jgi:hypothetical protein
VKGDGTRDYRSTYVLSLACFKLSRNLRPCCVVDSLVSAFALGVVCAHRVRQQVSSRSPHAWRAVNTAASASAAAGVLLRRRGGAGGGRGLLVNAVVARSLHDSPASQPTRLASLQPPPPPPSPPAGLHVPALSGASQGDRRSRPQKRWRPCASLRFPLRLDRRRVVYPSRSQGESMQGGVGCGGDVRTRCWSALSPREPPVARTGPCTLG